MSSHQVDTKNLHPDEFVFSFLTKGTGKLRTMGREYDLTAPCVFVQFCNTATHHFSLTDWDELFIIYEKKYIPQMESMRFLSVRNPVWHIQNYERFHPAFLLTLDYMENIHKHGMPDLFERSVQDLLMLSRIGRPAVRKEENDPLLRVASYLDAHAEENPDLKILLRSFDLSYSSFIRRWRKIYNIPPSKYLLKKRLEKAAELLIATELRVNEIAERLGFENHIYFSRQFDECYGLPATKYRAKHRGGSSGA